MHSNTSITCFCQGFQSFGVPELQNLVLVNGGHLLLVRQFDLTFYANLVHVLSPDNHKKGSFSIRCTDGIQVTKVIGPACIQEANTPSSTQWITGNVNGRTCYTVYLDMVGLIEEDTGHAYFQFVMHYTDVAMQRLITEVTTHRIPLTANRNTFLRSIDADVTAILLVKRAVLKARKKPDVDCTSEFIDDVLRNVAYKCGEKRASLYLLPDHLSTLPQLLFMARRGPLLGKVLQHRDDIDAVRSLFLQATPQPALKMIIPELLLVKEEHLEQLPPEGNRIFFCKPIDFSQILLCSLPTSYF